MGGCRMERDGKRSQKKGLNSTKKECGRRSSHPTTTRKKKAGTHAEEAVHHLSPPIQNGIQWRDSHANAMQQPDILQRHPRLAELLTFLNSGILTPTGLSHDLHQKLTQVRTETLACYLVATVVVLLLWTMSLIPFSYSCRISRRDMHWITSSNIWKAPPSTSHWSAFASLPPTVAHHSKPRSPSTSTASSVFWRLADCYSTDITIQPLVTT